MTRVLCILAGLIGMAACTQALDTRRPAQSSETLGTALYENLCQRIAATAYPDDSTGHRSRAVCTHGLTPAPGAPPKLIAFHQQRQRFIHAVDHAIDPALAHDLQTLLTELLPLYDNGLIPRQATSFSNLLRDLQLTRGASDALAWLSSPGAASPLPPAATLTHGLFTYPGLHELTEALVNVMGRQSPHRRAWGQLTAALRARLGDNAPVGAVDMAALAPWRDFFLSSAPQAAAANRPQWVVALDDRGLPLPTDHAAGVMVSVDEPPVANIGSGDDVGSLNALAPWGPPHSPGFDALGRAVDAQGNLRFVYYDAANSVLAGLLQQVQSLIALAPMAPLDAAVVIDAWLGAPKPQHRDSRGKPLHYLGYDAAPPAIANVAYTLGWLTQQQEVLATLIQLGRNLMEDNEPVLAQILHLGWQMAEWSQAPAVREAAVGPTDGLLNELGDIAMEMLRTDGLLEDLNVALADPNARRLGALLAKEMRTRDLIDFDVRDINAPPVGGFNTPVDRRRPDVRGNRSVFARLIHLVHDAQQPQCSKAAPMGMAELGPCEMFKIDDGALFYLQAIIGEARLNMRLPANAHDACDFTVADATDPRFANGLEETNGIRGFTLAQPPKQPGLCDPDPEDPNWVVASFSVTPAAAARLMFTTFDSRLDDTPFAANRDFSRQLSDEMTVDGRPFHVVHNATLFAWELDDFFAAIRPVIAAFAKHGQERLVLRILSTLHRHWPTLDNDMTQHTEPSRWDFATHTGLANLEEFFAQVLADGRATEVIGEVMARLHAVSIDGRPATAAIARLARTLMIPHDDYLPPAPPNTLAAPRGESPAYVMRLALRQLDRCNAEAPALESADHAGAVAQQLLAVDADGAGVYHLRNRQLLALLRAGLRFSEQRLEHSSPHDPRGEAWAQALNTAVQSPEFASLVQLAAAMGQTPQARRQLADAVAYLFQHHLPAVTQAVSTALTQASQLRRLDPLWRAGSGVLQSEDGFAHVALDVLQELQVRDSTQALPRLLAGLARADDGEMPMTALSDIFVQINRLDPGGDAPLTAHDYGQGLLPTLHDFVVDTRHGFARLLDIVAHRDVAAARGSDP